MNEIATYTLSEQLLGQLYAVLNTMPAGQVHRLLSALDAEIQRQDAERRQQARNELIASLTPKPQPQPTTQDGSS